MSTQTTSKTANSSLVKWAAGISIAMMVATFAAGTTLGLSSALATNLYFVLQGISWAGLAVGIVAGFGIGAALASTIFGLVKKWALRKFVAW